jgi:hypothetical protein
LEEVINSGLDAIGTVEIEGDVGSANGLLNQEAVVRVIFDVEERALKAYYIRDHGSFRGGPSCSSTEAVKVLRGRSLRVLPRKSFRA